MLIMLQAFRRPALDHLLSLAGYLVVAACYTLPLAAHWTSHVPGDNGDSIPHLWPFWYFAEAMTGRLSVDTGPLFYPTLQLYPDGISLVFANSSPIGAALMVPVTLLVSPAAALNSWLTLHLWLGGWFFYRFCRNLGAGAWGAWLGGFAYACSPFVAIHIPGHFTLVQVGFTAAALFLLSEVARRMAHADGGEAARHWLWPAVGLGLSCWAVAATDFYLAVMTLFLLAVALAHLALIYGRSFTPGSFCKALAGAAGLTAMLLLPWVWLVVQARAGHDYSPLDPSMGSSNVARWSRLVTLPAYHVIWGPRIYPEFVGKFPGISEYTYLGMVGLFVAFVGLAVRRDWRAATLWVAAFVLALGLAGANSYTQDAAWPKGHPLGFGRWWPRWFPLSEFRVPGRWQFALCTCLAVGVALGMDALVRRRGPVGRGIISVAIFGLMAFDLLRWPMPIVRAEPLDEGIAQAAEKAGAVVDIPVGIRSGAGHSVGQFDRETLLRQMVHGRPVLSANAARLANDVVAAREADAELQALLAVQAGNSETSRAAALDWAAFVERYDIETVRIPADWPTSVALRELVGQWGEEWQWSPRGASLVGERAP